MKLNEIIEVCFPPSVCAFDYVEYELRECVTLVVPFDLVLDFQEMRCNYQLLQDINIAWVKADCLEGMLMRVFRTKSYEWIVREGGYDG